MNASGRGRSSIGSAGTAMLVAVTGAAPLGAAALAAFLLRPPLEPADSRQAAPAGVMSGSAEER